jgi:hypothetical protein
MFDELKKYWKELDTTQKIMVILILPLTIPLGILYGLFLIFWNKYGLAFIIAVILAGTFSDQSDSETWEQAQALALLISFILLVRKAIKNDKKNET